MFSTHDRVVVLPDRLDGAAAVCLRDALLAQRGGEMSLDASKVQHFGAQCLQVLLAAFQTWRADGFKLRISEPSAPVRDAFDQFCMESSEDWGDHA